MELAAAAWKSVSSETIYSCWRHMGVVPDESNPSSPNVEPNHPASVRIPIPNTELENTNYEYLGLGDAYIHPYVRVMVDYPAYPVPTEQELTDEQISLGMDRLQLE
ncbi:hypothetical protein RhiTH_005893 [Rhizoctonia solani]|uniref:Uncharacterized protein n=1 Tax=Rhizoctonia solani TaxID=456999 RepID=A0A8H7HF42_9AGAM|nr:hypothetical protein RHS04_00136 [Rhizoctonia solani]KAF8754657.1 hypothetical protein RHS01_05911 [Rhizoctonia solani]